MSTKRGPRPRNSRHSRRLRPSTMHTMKEDEDEAYDAAEDYWREHHR